ncbi:MAG: hypothetical protein ACLR0N_00075 [Bilophila wadsworthia]
MTDLPPCQAASELRRLTDAALSAVAPDGAVLRHLHLDGGKLTLIDESGAPRGRAASTPTAVSACSARARARPRWRLRWKTCSATVSATGS